MDFLRTTIEQNLPFFNNLEEVNRALKVKLNSHKSAGKN